MHNIRTHTHVKLWNKKFVNLLSVVRFIGRFYQNKMLILMALELWDL